MSPLLRDSLVLFLELLGLFVGVSFVLNLLGRWLGDQRLRSLMGRSPLSAALRGIGVGFVTPFCTYSAIPVLVSLRRAGVTPAGYAAFIVAAPVLDPILFGALAIIVGVPAAVVYLVVAFLAALCLAFIAEKVDLERFMKPLGRSETQGQESGTDHQPWHGFRSEWRPALSASWGLLRTMLPLLVLGIAIGLAIAVFLPAETVARVPGLSGGASIPIAAAIGTFFYISTELFIPIADSLRGSGVGVGAIVALTIAGAAVNLPEFVMLSKLTRPMVLTGFAGYVFLVAVGGGILVDFLV